jgi:hypothetical protein
VNTTDRSTLVACPSCDAKMGEDCLNDQGRPVPWRHVGREALAFARSVESAPPQEQASLIAAEIDRHLAHAKASPEAGS